MRRLFDSLEWNVMELRMRKMNCRSPDQFILDSQRDPLTISAHSKENGMMAEPDDEMPKRLFFAVVGTSMVEAVDVPPKASITDVRRAIARVCEAEKYASEFTLYQTKGSDGEWLADGGKDLAALQQLRLSDEIKQTYLSDARKLKPTSKLDKAVPPPYPDEMIHILAARQEHKRPSSTPSDALEDDVSTKKLIRVVTTTFVELPAVKWMLAPTACPKVNLPRIGTCLRIPRHYFDGSGVKAPMTEEHALLYVREEVVNEWRYIQHNSVVLPSRLWIIGAPGVGKSCAAFAFACNVDRTKWDVVWIHYDSDTKDLLCVKFVGDEKETCRIEGEETTPEVVKGLLQPWTKATSRPLIVFFDGYNKVNPMCVGVRDKLVRWQWKGPNRRLVTVTSMAALGKEVNEAHNVIVEGDNGEEIESNTTFKLASWTREEYLAAIAVPEFFDSVRKFLTPEKPSGAAPPRPTPDESSSEQPKSSGEADKSSKPLDILDRVAADSSTAPSRSSGGKHESTELTPPTPQELIEQKFYLAGGNARAMFSLRFFQIVSYIKGGMSKADDVVAHLLGSVGESSSQVINRLLAGYKGSDGDLRITIVSALAARLLAVRVGPEMILSLTRVICVNPAMDGFAFEAYVLSCMSRGGVEYTTREGETGKWDEANVNEFDPAAAKLNIQQTWNIPTKWNQGGYDAVFLQGPDKDPEKMRVVFVQMTRSKQHSFKADPFIGLLHKLRAAFPCVSSVQMELCYVVPLRVLTEFNIPIKVSDLKRQVGDVAYLPDKRPAAGRDVVESPEIKCSVRLVGVKYPSFDAVARVWRS